MSIDLLLIDPQNDFCSPDGSLYVPGAEKDCKNTADFIYNNMDKIDSIHITLDSHPVYHIAHPIFWKMRDGNQPPVYTQISYTDLTNGTYTPADEGITKRIEDYLLNLEARGKYKLTLWPPHCLLSTWGFCTDNVIWNAAHTWETQKPGRSINFVVKTMNPFTEHYSAIQAEVPDPSDPATRTNFVFIDKIKNNNIIVAGEALSHCVSNSIRDLCAYIPASQITLLTDCTSNVTGFEREGKDFLDSYTAKGMKAVLSTELKL